MQKFCRTRKTNILLVTTLLMMALDCFAQKPMSLKLLKQQDVYVLDSSDLKSFSNDCSEKNYPLRVISPTTDKNKVFRLWVDMAPIEQIPIEDLNFPNLQELQIFSCCMPQNLTQYPLLQILVYQAFDEVCLGTPSNDDYINLMVSPLPKQIFQLKNLKKMYLEYTTSISVVMEEDISKLKKLKDLYVEGKLYVPASYCKKKLGHIHYFNSAEGFTWHRRPIIDFFRHIYKKRTYRKDGHIFIKAHYKMGKPNGEWLVYGKNGEIVQRRFYKNGLEHGKWLIKWKNSYGEEEFLEYEFDNGTLISIKESYYGDCRVIENFNDFPNRTVKILRGDGQCYEKEVYKNNNLIKTYERLSDTEYKTQDIVDTVGGKIYYEKIYENDSLLSINYLRLETKKIKEDLYVQTIYENGDIFWKKLRKKDQLSTESALSDRYIFYQNQLWYNRKVKKETTIEEILEPYYLKIEKTTETRGFNDYKITFYDKDGNIFGRWYVGYPESIKERIDEEINKYMYIQKELEKK